jgi:TrmH family RNA methyltransferase
MSQSLHTLVRDLRRKRGRERRGLALAEGVRLVEEALAAGVAIRHVVASPGLEATPRGRALQAALGKAGHRPDAVSERVFEELAATEQPQGILAVVELPRRSLDQVRPAPGKPVLVLDGVQDPGNVGTVVRTALGLGAAGIVALPGTAEVTNPKTLRATMGAVFRLPVVAASDEEFRGWVGARRPRLLLARAGAPPPDPETRRTAAALVVGNEGAGIRPALASLAAGSVGIPLQAGVESLNVAVAAGILLWEMTRE